MFEMNHSRTLLSRKLRKDAHNCFLESAGRMIGWNAQWIDICFVGKNNTFLCRIVRGFEAASEVVMADAPRTPFVFLTWIYDRLIDEGTDVRG